jgi:hypothetical protein
MFSGNQIFKPRHGGVQQMHHDGVLAGIHSRNGKNFESRLSKKTLYIRIHQIYTQAVLRQYLKHHSQTRRPLF